MRFAWLHLDPKEELEKLQDMVDRLKEENEQLNRQLEVL